MCVCVCFFCGIHAHLDSGLRTSHGNLHQIFGDVDPDLIHHVFFFFFFLGGDVAPGNAEEQSNSQKAPIVF